MFMKFAFLWYYVSIIVKSYYWLPTYVFKTCEKQYEKETWHLSRGIMYDKCYRIQDTTYGYSLDTRCIRRDAALRQPVQWYLLRLGDDLFDVRWLTWVTRLPFNVSTLNRSYCERPRWDGRTPRTKHGSPMLLDAHTRMHARMCIRAPAHLCLIISRRDRWGLVVTFDAGGHGQNTWRSGDKIASVISFAIPFDTKIILRVAYRKLRRALLRFGLDIPTVKYVSTDHNVPEPAWTPEVWCGAAIMRKDLWILSRGLLDWINTFLKNFATFCCLIMLTSLYGIVYTSYI